jgi:hypothetical protein
MPAERDRPISLRGPKRASPNSGARSAADNWRWIFFKKPCGHGREAPQQRRDYLFGLVKQMTRHEDRKAKSKPRPTSLSLPERGTFARQLLSLARAQDFSRRRRPGSMLSGAVGGAL